MPNIARRATLWIGVALALLGLWWIARNRGLTGTDFMMEEMQWLYRGLVLVALGTGMALLSRRMR
ncbi:MAG: hypothetical protein ISS15_04395 [Alphaproteobacteria bacterium]|nr:hypothetical protein [Alphaproteobacteria bacterium]MBL6940214.1 hypothetical protein [Alphaproteobacteria bacterium]MBL7096878.1 hypothetical protein [Alphaproteobacteria bacterium]